MKRRTFICSPFFAEIGIKFSKSWYADQNFIIFKILFFLILSILFIIKKTGFLFFLISFNSILFDFEKNVQNYYRVSIKEWYTFKCLPFAFCWIWVIKNLSLDSRNHAVLFKANRKQIGLSVFFTFLCSQKLNVGFC